MEQISWARRLLEESGYYVRMSEDQLLFEDETLYGFISFHEKVIEILEHWEKIQDIFLRKNSLAIRRGSLKSWNAYSVFLSMDNATELEQLKLTDIEEDFRATRKIVKTEIVTPASIKRALLPVLPIQHPVQLSSENMKARILERISLTPKQKEALFSDATAEDLLSLVLGGE